MVTALPKQGSLFQSKAAAAAGIAMSPGENVQNMKDGMGVLVYRANLGYYEENVCWKAVDEIEESAEAACLKLTVLQAPLTIVRFYARVWNTWQGSNIQLAEN